MDSHWRTIGMNFSDSAANFSRFEAINAYAVYMDQIIHNHVLTDTGVKWVSVNHHVQTSIGLPLHDDSDTNVSTADLQFYLRGANPHLHHSRRWVTGFTKFLTWPQRMVNAGEKIDLSAGGDTGLAPSNFFVNPGLGVHIYIVDTGVRITHKVFHQPDFKGTAANFNGPHAPYVDDPNPDDKNGHGTSVASVAFMHATGANIVNVKASGKEGTRAWVAQAIEDIVAEHQRFQAHKPYDTWRGSVINISAGFPGTNQYLRDPLRRAYEAGIPVVAAAGNDGRVPDPTKYLCK
ncbi:MAG: hypothetical protein Q9227_009409 [Pyrenula ochraceoflavens]